MKRLLRITLLLLLVALFYCNYAYQIYAFHPFMDSDTGTLKVMTWNIHNSDPNFKQKEADISQLILEQDADVVLLNEFYIRKDTLLHNAMNRHYPYANAIGAKVLSGDILYSKHPILRAARIKNDTITPLCYEFLLQINKDTLRIVGCHLISTNIFSKEHRYTLKKKSDLSTLPDYYKIYLKAQERRTIEAHLISDLLRNDTHPTLVMGDMNDFSGTPPLQTIEDAGLKDAWWNAGTGFGFTFHEGWMHFRLDHILYNSKVNLRTINVLKTKLSDHLPVVAEIDVTP